MKKEGREVAIVASSSLFYNNPELKAECKGTDELEKSFDDLLGETVAFQFFIAEGQSETVSHSEPGYNVYRQIAGRKKWTLFSPHYSYLVAPQCAVSGVTVTPGYFMDTEMRELVTSKLPRMEVTLDPGDILVNAPWFYHDIKAEGSSDEILISVAARVLNLKDSLLNSPLFFSFTIFRSIMEKKALKKTKAESFDKYLQDNVEASYYGLCVESGRTDCLTEA